jgi:hypothetical protein
MVTEHSVDDYVLTDILVGGGGGGGGDDEDDDDGVESGDSDRDFEWENVKL